MNGLFFIRWVLCLFLTGTACAFAQGIPAGQTSEIPLSLESSSAPTIFSKSGSSLPDLDNTPLEGLGGGPEAWTSPEGLSSSLQVLLLLTVLSLAPAVLLMTTCYVRIIIVLGLLRQAIGLQSLPPSQVMTSIALFMTLFVMSPVWSRVYSDAIKPKTQVSMTMEEAYEDFRPIQFMARRLMWREITMMCICFINTWTLMHRYQVRLRMFRSAFCYRLTY